MLRKYYIIIYIIFSLIYTSFSQSYRFKFFNSENDGIYPYIYSIHQDSIGFIWVGTGDGLYRFDGHSFKNYDLSRTSGDNFISASYAQNNKNWFGHNNGKITLICNNNVSNIDIPVQNPGSINSIISDNQGNIWFATQNSGICKYTKNNKIILYSKPFEGQQIYSICCYNNLLLIGTGNGLYYFNPSIPTEIKSVENSPQTKIECIYFSKSQNQIYFGTEDEGMFTLKNNTINKEFNELNLSDFPIKDIVCENNGSIWIATMGNGILNIPFSTNNNVYVKPIFFNNTNGLNSLNIKKLLFDREKNIWLGTYGSGLATFYENYFTFILSTENNNLSITALHPGINCIWAGTTGKLIKIENDKIETPKFFEAKDGIPNDKINSLFLDKDNVLWIGTDKNGVFYFDTKTEKIKPFLISEDQLMKSVSSIDGFGDKIYIGTHNGLIEFDKTTNKKIIFTTINGLPHNYINNIITDLNSNLWIATPTNYLICYNNGKINKIKISQSDEPLKINSICFDLKGKLWLATYGNGVYYKSDTTFKKLSSQNGLLSDYCYSIISDETGTIWVGHRQGISSINQNVVQQFSRNKGISTDCNLNAVCTDKNGIVWFGTNNGIIRYDFRKNAVNKIPPDISVNSIKFNDIEIKYSENITMPYNKYKLKIEFSGITFRNPELVTYKYKLEGYDQDWSEISYNNFATFSNLQDGEYTLKILAFNSHGISNKKPFEINIIVEPPFWKKWWVILIAFVIILYLLYLFIKIRERNHRKLEELLQKKLDERTHEVVVQKELIEQKNKDITDSINYAKRIQEAILPNLSKLQSCFPDSFVFYQPRDIVSGDFYVFHKSENKFILICADATGHGVPGAFMSLICSTILKDILNNKHIYSPSQILYELDKELQTSLQSQENIKTNDGLDIAVCEINLETNELVFSSAMRPIILVLNNKVEYTRGSKYSIGASQYAVNKEFIEHTFQLNKNDCIYLFSDGIVDQFGGSKAKKLKISGLQKWLTELNPLTMPEQQKTINQFFNNWKGINSQIDDVLIIGIKI